MEKIRSENLQRWQENQVAWFFATSKDPHLSRELCQSGESQNNKLRCGRKLNSHPRHHPHCRRHLLAHRRLQSCLLAAREPEIQRIKTNISYIHGPSYQPFTQFQKHAYNFRWTRFIVLGKSGFLTGQDTNLCSERFKNVILKFSPGGNNWFSYITWGPWMYKWFSDPVFHKYILSNSPEKDR